VRKHRRAKIATTPVDRGLQCRDQRAGFARWRQLAPVADHQGHTGYDLFGVAARRLRGPIRGGRQRRAEPRRRLQRRAEYRYWAHQSVENSNWAIRSAGAAIWFHSSFPNLIPGFENSLGFLPSWAALAAARADLPRAGLSNSPGRAPDW